MDIDKLDDVTGEGTTLVSLLLPAGYNISQAKQLLVSERSEAKNIKNKSTRKKVQSALKKAQSQLRELGEVPENGVAIYTKHDESYTHIPEKPLNQKLYRCDNSFHTQPVKDLNKIGPSYGIIVADRDRYRVGVADVRGNVTGLVSEASGIPSKHSKGGQSAQRWERYRSEKKKNYVSTISDTAQKQFLTDLRNNNLIGLILAGTLNKEIKQKLNGELRQAIVSETCISQGLRQAFRDTNQNLPTKKELASEKTASKFLQHLSEETGKAEYGEKQIRKACEMAAVKTLMVPENQYV